MTETGTATGAETEATMTGFQTETGTDNSTEVGTGRTPETKTETGHNRETGTQGTRMVTQETEDTAKNGDKKEQLGQILGVQTGSDQAADQER
jgi:hypothetical protein